jgi:two-component system chemotaxis response regulator CheY
MPRGPVLVVEDDDDIRDAVGDALADGGYAFVLTSDGRAALDYLSSHPPPALVLLDWNMTPMNGEAVVAEATRDPALAGVPIVVVSADARVADLVRLPGVVGYLEKPIDLDALFEVVGRYCESERHPH